MIPLLIKSIIEQQAETRFDRSHLKQIGASALEFESVYFVLSSDYKTHMDIQQNILLEIHRKLSEMSIEIAYPTQTIFLESTLKC